MEETAQIDSRMQQEVKQQVQDAGFPVETVTPDTADSPLKLVGEALGQNADEAKRFWVSGGGPARNVPSKTPLQILKDKLRGHIRQNEQLVEKAV